MGEILQPAGISKIACWWKIAYNISFYRNSGQKSERLFFSAKEKLKLIIKLKKL